MGHHLRRGCWLLLLLAGAGCDRRDADLVPVRGRVYYRGQPLAGGTIVFTPDPGRGGAGPLARAEIGPDGTYALRTGARPGAVAGWHTVTVAGARGKDKRPPALPRRYSDPELSGQSAEVKPGQANVHDVHLD
jgi:hypothetical protein